MSFVIAQNDATDVQAVGGKAAALARLAANGFNPPTFFVIRAEAFETTGPVDGLDEALAMLGPGPFAVRSSARAEDGADHSHAGQFDTHLNVAARTSGRRRKRSGAPVFPTRSQRTAP
jgi:phosphoenolpyruvate synthase/pyruvate phosphate dikinase